MPKIIQMPRRTKPENEGHPIHRSMILADPIEESESLSKIQRWLEREGGHPNLVLLYDSDHPIGRTIHRGGDQSEPCSHALVVLKWDEGGKYHVLTSYPEC